MRKLFSLIVALTMAALSAPAFAQGNQTFGQRWFWASDYGQWQVVGQQANTYQWSPGTLCNTSAVGNSSQFFVFNTNAPVEIVDPNTTLSEVVTPSAVTQSNSFCSITVAPSNTHYSFRVQSGTGGLQEALNNLSPTLAAPVIVWLDPNWYTLANNIPGTTPASIIAASTGGVSRILVDNTTAPFTYYIWGGSAYASGTWVNTKPAAAAGAAAGTSPTISDAGSALSGTVSLTAGSATTTGTLFTLTYGLNSSPSTSQFLYAPTCTVSSIGANVSPAVTVATTYPSSTHALVTVTVAVAPVAATAYKYQYACH